MNVTTCSLQCVNKEEKQRWIKNTLGVFFYTDRFDASFLFFLTLEILDFYFLFPCWKFDWIHQSLSRTISLLKRVLTYTHGQCYKEKEGFLFFLFVGSARIGGCGWHQLTWCIEPGYTSERLFHAVHGTAAMQRRRSVIIQSATKLETVKRKKKNIF
jgi:hypothetical protein